MILLITVFNLPN